MTDAGPKGSWSVYRRLLEYVKPYVGRLLLGMLFGLVFAGANTGLFAALRSILKDVFNPAETTLATTLTLGGLLILVAMARGISFYLSSYLIEWVGNRVVMDLRNQTFAHLHELSVLYFTRSRTGELISRTANDTMLLQRAVSSVIGELMRQPFVLLGVAGFLIWLEPLLALVSLLMFPVCILPVALFGRRVRRFAREGQQKLADLVSIIQETITGVRIVKAFGMENYERSRFAERCKGVFSRAMRVTKARSAVEPIVVLISVIGLSLVLLYSRWMQVPAETFITFGAALVGMYDPVKKLSRMHINIQQSSAAAERVFEILDTEITVKESPDAVELEEPIGEIVFDQVSFAYDEEPVLEHCSLKVEAGRCVALVGSSGSGKTTMVNLLPRFFDVTDGRIAINGRDIRTFTLSSLRRHIGMVSQDTILFNDTVANNISYGHTTEVPREQITEAARRAHAHEFIVQMPQGYDTVIGERGVRLSGGQAQRLAIARALFRNPPIMILDEATSALDTESERQVQAAIDELMAHRTVFAIAHRLSTITHADAIIVLSQGRIIEHGSHNELMALDGHYKHLHDLQFTV